ncbi:hypothetical protein ACFPRL_19260 [Pseudoclavibacter helvolus]
MQVAEMRSPSASTSKSGHSIPVRSTKPVVVGWGSLMSHVPPAMIASPGARSSSSRLRATRYERTVVMSMAPPGRDARTSIHRCARLMLGSESDGRFVGVSIVGRESRSPSPARNRHATGRA